MDKRHTGLDEEVNKNEGQAKNVHIIRSRTMREHTREHKENKRWIIKKKKDEREVGQGN